MDFAVLRRPRLLGETEQRLVSHHDLASMDPFGIDVGQNVEHKYSTG